MNTTKSLWDEVKSLKRVNHSKETLLKDLKIFIYEVYEHFDILRLSVESTDNESAYLYSKSVKILSANIFSTQVSTLAEEIELKIYRFREQNIITGIDENINTLKNSIDRLVDELKIYIKENSNVLQSHNTIPIKDAIDSINEIIIKLKLGFFIDTFSMDLFQSTIHNRVQEKILQFKKEINSFDTDGSITTANDILFILDLIDKGKIDD